MNITPQERIARIVVGVAGAVLLLAGSPAAVAAVLAVLLVRPNAADRPRARGERCRQRRRGCLPLVRTAMMAVMMVGMGHGNNDK